MKPTVVVCDDEELIRWSLCAHLESEGFHTISASNGEEAVAAVVENGAALLLTDLKMPKMDGLTAIRELRKKGYEIPVIVLTAHGGVESAIEATQLGAAGYLQKPFDVREVSLAIEKALDNERMRAEIDLHRRKTLEGYGEFIGNAPVLQPLFDLLKRLERVAAPTVLINGESGTGKDVLARSIHARGPRATKPFVAVDCASLPEQLIESELFGHERGAFTDARTMKKGLFEIAEGGLLFLDEIGELPIGTQSKLLRALEERTFKRVGGITRFPLNVGILAASNRNLEDEVKAGRFRQDLFFRLNVIAVKVPPLRDRRSDIPTLFEHFLTDFSRRLGRSMEGLDRQAMERLQEYSWPGNVRELRNMVERLVILCPDPLIRVEHLPPEIQFSKPTTTTTGDCAFVLPEQGIQLESVEKSLIVQALERTDYNQSASARLLGISRYALRYRMEKFKLSKP